MLLLAWIVPGTCAQERHADAALRSWLLAPPRPENEALLERAAAGFHDIGELDAALARLAVAAKSTRRFRRIDIPAEDPLVVLAVVVPGAAPPPAGFPLVLAPAPSLVSPPSELAIRARYGSWLDRGFVVVVPVPPHQVKAGRTSSGSDVHDPGSDLVPVAVAAVSLELGVDRDRVVLHARVPLPPVTGPARVRPFLGDTTAIATVYHLAPGDVRLDEVAEPWLFRGRTIVHHLSDQADEAALRAARRTRAALDPVAGRHRTIEDRDVRYPLRVGFGGRGPDEVIALPPRSKAAEAFELRLGNGLPASFEGLELTRAHPATRLMLRGTDETSAVSITTPDDPTTATLPLRIYVESGAGAPEEFRLNGRPLRPQEDGVRTRLLLARRNLQSGRSFTRVLDTTP